VGRVLTQVPEAGGSLPRGAEVVVEVVRGTPAPALPSVVLPSYVGTDVSTAQADLQARGLVATVTTTPGGPDGRVTSQSPEAGVAVAPGTAVVLVVARVPPLEAVVTTEPAHRTSVPRAYGAVLRWLPVAGAEDYQVEILEFKDGAWVLYANDVSKDLQHTLTKTRRGTYQWHVRARRDRGRAVGPWSEWRQITWY
jgi:hypothetical protein